MELYISRKKADERIHYYDLLRIVSFLFIIVYHMVLRLCELGVVSSNVMDVLFGNDNIHIAKLAVSVFFILSGAGLSVSDKFFLVEYLKKRFVRIILPFYVANMVYYLYYYLYYRVFYLSKFTDVPKIRFVYTVLGTDEWLHMHKYETYSSYIGEWFLGLLIVFYLLYPFLRYIINKVPKVFFIAATFLYVIVAFNYIWLADYVPVHQSLFMKLYEFILGIYFGKYVRSFPRIVQWVSLGVFLFLILYRGGIGIPEGFINTIVAVSMFISFSLLEGYLKNKPRFNSVVMCLCAYSYEVFLSHHFIIYEFTKNLMGGKELSAGLIICYVLLLIAVIISVGVLIKLISDKIVGVGTWIKNRAVKGCHGMNNE